MELIEDLKTKYRNMPVQARAGLWFFISSFIQKAINSISTPVFTRLLTREEFGQFSVFNSWLNLIAIFVSLNLFMGVYMQGIVKFEKERAQYTSSLQGLSLTLVCAWTVIYLIFSDFWNRLFSLTTVQMLAMLVLIWTSAVFGFWSAQQRVLLKYRQLVTVSVMAALVKPIVGVIFVLHANDKVTARILGIALVEIIFYSWMFFHDMLTGRQFYSGRFWKYVLRFNIPLIPHYLSMSVLNSADRIMISRMVGDGEAGIYNLAYSVSLIMTLFNTALLQAIEPWIYKKIKEKRLDKLASVAYPTFFMIAVVNLILIVMAPEVVAIFAPKEYYDAIWVIPPVAMSVFFIYAYSFFATIEFYYEKTKYVAAASMIGAVLNVVLNYIFIPVFGYYVAGYTTLFCYVLYTLFHYMGSRKVCRDYFYDQQAYDVKILLAITGSFMLAGFLLLLTYRNLFVRYSIVLLAVIAGIIKRKSLFAMVDRILKLRKAEDV